MLRSSHSQTTTDFHPLARRRLRWIWSRLTFSANLRAQKDFLDLGEYAYRQLLCRCQKQPCTNTTVRLLTRTMSGFPGKSARCNLNRRPIRCRIDRTCTSGLVSRALMRDMFQLRRAGVILSAIAFSCVNRATQDRVDRLRDLIGEERRDSVPNLPVLLGSGTLEEIVIRESLKASGLSHCQAPALRRVGVDEVVTVFGDVADDRRRGGIPQLNAKTIGKSRVAISVATDVSVTGQQP